MNWFDYVAAIVAGQAPPRTGFWPMTRQALQQMASVYGGSGDVTKAETVLTYIKKNDEEYNHERSVE
jgi:hypothetical protein